MRANIYIRKENEEAWEKLENKSDWVNERLEGNTVGDLAPKLVERLSNGLCKVHGLPLDSRGRCLQKGCE